MATEINLTSLSFNASSTGYAVAGTSTDTFYISCDKFSKLLLLGKNNDTAACSVTIHDGSTGTYNDFIARNVGDLSTSIAGSSAVQVFGPFESARFKSTSNTLVISTTGSTASTNVTWYAWQMP